MEVNSNVNQNKPELCVQCKQFFGSTEKHNMCSKCFNDYEKQRSKKNSAEELLLNENQKQQAQSSVPKEDQKLCRDSKCDTCDKRVGIWGFKCKCLFIFCKAHRLPEQHSCTYDYNQNGKTQLAANLTKCAADKIERI